MSKFIRFSITIFLLVSFIFVGNSPVTNCNSFFIETNQSLQIRFEIGNTSYWVNEIPVERQVAQETPPVIKNNRTFILLRYLAKQLPWIGGMEFEKDSNLYPKGRVEINFTDRDKKIYLYVDNPIAEITEDGKTESIMIDPENGSVVPFIISGRLHLPLRFLGEQTNAIKILWDEDKKLVELWYFSPYEIPLTNRPPINGYSTSRAKFSEMVHHTETLDDFSFDEYWEIKIEYNSWDSSAKNVLCVSKKLASEIEKLKQEESNILFKYLLIGEYAFIVDVQKDESETIDCCDFDVDFEVEKVSDKELWRTWIYPKTSCNQPINLRTRSKVDKQELSESGIDIYKEEKLYGTYCSEQNNKSLIPVDNNYYEQEHSDDRVLYPSAFDIVTTENGRIHIAWVERRYPYRLNKEYYSLNYVYYDGNTWKNVKDEPYPENSALVSKHTYDIRAVDLEIDTEGNPHIVWSFINKTYSNSLKYAKWNRVVGWVDSSSTKTDYESNIYKTDETQISIHPIKLLLDNNNDPYIFWLDKDIYSEEGTSKFNFIYSKEPGIWLNHKNKNISIETNTPYIRDIFSSINREHYITQAFSVIMDKKNDIHLVYQADYDEKCCIFYDVYKNGELTISTDPVYHIGGFNPMISLDDDNNPVIVWSENYIISERLSSLSRIFFIKKSDNGWENIQGESIQNNSALLFYQSSRNLMVPKVYPLKKNEYVFSFHNVTDEKWKTYTILRYWSEDNNLVPSAKKTFPYFDTPIKGLWTMPQANINTGLGYIFNHTYNSMYLYKTSDSDGQLKTLDNQETAFDYSGKMELDEYELEYLRGSFVVERDKFINKQGSPIAVDIIIESDCGKSKEYSIKIE